MSKELPSREVHIDCGGTVVLKHEWWCCRKCRRRPLSVYETKTVYSVDPDRKVAK
jgi:hypothetical protein